MTTGEPAGMTTSPMTPLSSLKRRLYLLGFVDEFGPLYAVYTLWFNDHGVSTSQVSTVFLVWAAVALALEIPSGAVADRVDRRRLLAGAFGVRAVGISIWLVWPTLTGVLVGAALWATHDALASGSWEALIHDELTGVGRADAYAPVMARIGQFSHLGIALGTVFGAVLLRADVGIVALGWVTVAAHAGSVTMVATLPDVRWVARRHGTPSTPRQPAIGAGPVAELILDDIDDPAADASWSYRAWWATLREGVRNARHTPMVAKLVTVGAMLEGLFLIDEYVPLLARARGGDDAAAPVIVFVVWIGLLLGGEIAARRTGLRSRSIGLALIAATAVTTIAFVSNSVWALMLIPVGYGALEVAWIATDARMQERTPPATRATVTSVRGFGSAMISMAAFVVIGVMSDGDDPTPGHFVVLAALVMAGALIVRWLPERDEMHG